MSSKSFSDINNSFGGKIVARKKFLAYLTFGLLISSVALSYLNGFLFGIDFIGGTVIEFSIEENITDIDIMHSKMANILSDDKFNLQLQGDSDWLCKFGLSSNLDVDKFKQSMLSEFSGIKFLQIESVGPQVSSGLAKQAFVALSFSLFSIIVYLMFRFNRHFSVSGVLVLLLDVTLSFLFVSFFKIEVNLTVMSAFLTIIGYCVNDTVVLYDRIRNKILSLGKNIDRCTAMSLNEVLRRSIITSVVTMLSLVGMIIFSSGDIKDFAIIVSFGIFVGTLGSIFLASTLPLYFNMKISDFVIKKPQKRDPMFYAN